MARFLARARVGARAIILSVLTTTLLCSQALAASEPGGETSICDAITQGPPEYLSGKLRLHFGPLVEDIYSDAALTAALTGYAVHLDGLYCRVAHGEVPEFIIDAGLPGASWHAHFMHAALTHMMAGNPKAAERMKKYVTAGLLIRELEVFSRLAADPEQQWPSFDDWPPIGTGHVLALMLNSAPGEAIKYSDDAILNGIAHSLKAASSTAPDRAAFASVENFGHLVRFSELASMEATRNGVSDVQKMVAANWEIALKMAGMEGRGASAQVKMKLR